MKEVINASVRIYFDDGESEFFTKVEGIQVESDFIYHSPFAVCHGNINKSRVKFVFVKEKGVK